MRLLVAAACLGPCRLAKSWCARPHRRPLQPLPFMVLRPLKGAGYARTRLIWTVRVSPSPPGYASDSACPFPLRRQTFDFIPAQNPTIVYLPGLEQNRLGTTAFALQTWAKRNRQGFFTADYFGCGKSEGEYADATISRWVEDTVELVEQEIKGPVVLVGSGVGGWIAMHVAQRLPKMIKGLVGIAADPDFTTDVVLPKLDDATKVRHPVSFPLSRTVRLHGEAVASFNVRSEFRRA